MTVTELKKYIYEQDKVEYVLEQIGCHHIQRHEAKERISACNFDGDNSSAINIKLNEYLNCKNYTREKDFNEHADIITLVQYNKSLDFKGAIKYLHKILDLPLTYSKPEEKPKEKFDPLYIFKKVQCRKCCCNVLDADALNEIETDDYVPMIHISWFREGIMPPTIKKFGLGYSYRYKRNVIPLKYWLNGKLLGYNQRTTVENYELFDIKKYFLTPNYPKQFNLYGLWENQESIHKLGYVTVFEAEKSVLKRDSRIDPSGVALSGHTMSDEQVRILIGLDVDIVVALDNDIDIQEVRHMCEKFYNIRPVYYIKDQWGLLGEKDSPADAPDKIYQFLMKHKIKYDEKEHREYLKLLNKKEVN